MYHLRPERLYLLDRARSNTDSLTRMNRILSALGKSSNDVHVVSADELYDVARELQAWPSTDLREDCPAQHQRPLVFTHIAIDAREHDSDLLANRPADVKEDTLKRLLGHIPLVRNTHPPEDDAVKNLVCWNTQDFGVMSGCPHGCQYCGFGKSGTFIAVGLNIDEYMDKVVEPTIEKTPGQRCFRMIGWAADIITFEPEYGVFGSFMEKLSEYEERYGYFHTASDNVDWMADLPNRDRLIGVWSTTCGKVAREIEPGSPSAVSRIDAGRKCKELGIPIRFKFKPMIPVRNWREEYADIIKHVFDRTRPETIGFCVLMWMNLEDLKQKIDLELLDADYVRAAAEAADTLQGVRTGPFPHDVRAEIYRFLIREVRRWDKKIPLFISTESREMWDELRNELGQNPRTFVCGCNPIQLPGPKMRFGQTLKQSTYVPPQATAAK